MEFQLWVVPCPQYSNHHVSWHLCSSQPQTPHSSTTETVPSNPLHLCVFISGYWQFLQLLVKLWSSPRSLLPPVSSHILRVIYVRRWESCFLIVAFIHFSLPSPSSWSYFSIVPQTLTHTNSRPIYYQSQQCERILSVKEFPLLHPLLLQKTTKCEPVERREHSKSEQSKSFPECELQEVLINLPLVKSIYEPCNVLTNLILNLVTGSTWKCLMEPRH